VINYLAAGVAIAAGIVANLALMSGAQSTLLSE
jgi:hypothetical protein